jgi:hypothetical protein
MQVEPDGGDDDDDDHHHHRHLIFFSFASVSSSVPYTVSFDLGLLCCEDISIFLLVPLEYEFHLRNAL